LTIVDNEALVLDTLRTAKRVAVLGIKTRAQRSAPAFYVPAYLQRAGYEIIPVPVYYPEVEEILGERVYRRVSDIPGEVDLVVVFRRSEDVGAHVDDIVAKRPRAVWLQLGIRDDEAAARLSAAGIDVIQDRCTMVDHRRII
jgi:uncharacterized protein